MSRAAEADELYESLAQHWSTDADGREWLVQRGERRRLSELPATIDWRFWVRFPSSDSERAKALLTLREGGHAL